VGSLADAQAAAQGVALTDLCSTVLMPGFIDPHSHPLLGGLVSQEPAHWISPYMGYPTYTDVEAFWKNGIKLWADGSPWVGTIAASFSYLDTPTVQKAPIPLLNVQAMVTRRIPSGAVHGANQAVGIDDAFTAHTINAAFQLKRENDLGSIAVGKLGAFLTQVEAIDPSEHAHLAAKAASPACC